MSRADSTLTTSTPGGSGWWLGPDTRVVCEPSRASAPGNLRPRLVIGFAAETENVIEAAKAKRKAKGCDWMVANDVSPETGILAGDSNTVHLVTAGGVEDWPRLSKTAVAERLAARVAEALKAS